MEDGTPPFGLDGVDVGNMMESIDFIAEFLGPVSTHRTTLEQGEGERSAWETGKQNAGAARGNVSSARMHGLRCAGVSGTGILSGNSPHLWTASIGDHFIHNAVIFGLNTGHIEIPVSITLDLFQRPASMNGKNVIELFSKPENLSCLDLNVRGLALKPSHRLVKHDAHMGKGKTLSLDTGGKQNRCHAGRLPHAQGRDVGLDVLDRIVDGQTGCDQPTR